MESAIFVVYMVGVIRVANRIDAQKEAVRPVLAYPYGTAALAEAEADTNPRPWIATHNFLLAAMIGMVVLIAAGVVMGAAAEANPAFAETATPTEPLNISLVTATSVFLLAIVGAGLSVSLMASARARVYAGRIFGDAFRPTSRVHLTALIFALTILVMLALNYALIGGLEGVAEEVAENGISPWDSVLSLVVMPLMAALGVGLFIRRDWRAVLHRLGLTWPNTGDIVAGLLTAAGCYLFIIAGAGVWLLLAPDALAEQSVASEQISLALGASLPVAFLAATSAAVGEEILFRGALQPVFGLAATSIFFAAVHLQYAFTPASVMIALVGLAMGVLRERRGTTAAIIAHFAYNFVQLALVTVFA